MNGILGVRPEKTCEQCGECYKAIQPHQKFCSSACKDRARVIRQNILRKEQYHNDPKYRQAEIDRSSAYDKNRKETDPEYKAQRLKYSRDYHRRKRAKKEEK
jgi:predicted nucleic acid-binding Zn ribbon protein